MMFRQDIPEQSPHIRSCNCSGKSFKLYFYRSVIYFFYSRDFFSISLIIFVYSFDITYSFFLIPFIIFISYDFISIYKIISCKRLSVRPFYSLLYFKSDFFYKFFVIIFDIHFVYNPLICRFKIIIYF